MVSVFENIRELGPAAFILKAILAAVVLDGLLLGFILLRRTYRGRYFAKRDALVLELRGNWDALISGKIPYETWRTKSLNRETVEELVLDRLETAQGAESASLVRFLRASGLIEKLICEARHHRGWRRQHALIALGRTRCPEAIPALGEGLNDQVLETRFAALRGLGRMACPEAGKEVLDWMVEARLQVPSLPLQMALIQCCAERPQILLPYLQPAQGNLREVLGRVLGEVATPVLGEDLLEFAEDALPELRAAAARAFSNVKSGLALNVLIELSGDPVWFVRLRSIISLGKACHSATAPSLLRGLTDSNRLVRLRAAEGLVNLKSDPVGIFEKVVAQQDRYGLHAFLTAVENADKLAHLEYQIKASEVGLQSQMQLLEILHTGALPTEPSSGGSLSVGHAASKR